jgi:hypothetical protein
MICKDWDRCKFFRLKVSLQIQHQGHSNIDMHENYNMNCINYI